MSTVSPSSPVRIEYLEATYTFDRRAKCVDDIKSAHSLALSGTKKAEIDALFRNAEQARTRCGGARAIAYDTRFASVVKRLDPFYTNCAYTYPADATDTKTEEWQLVATTLSALDRPSTEQHKMPAEYMCSCAEHHNVRRAYWFYHPKQERFICLGTGCLLKFKLGSAAYPIFKRAFRKCVGCLNFGSVKGMINGECPACRVSKKRAAPSTKTPRTCDMCLRIGQGCTCCGPDSRDVMRAILQMAATEFCKTRVERREMVRLMGTLFPPLKKEMLRLQGRKSASKGQCQNALVGPRAAAAIKSD